MAITLRDGCRSGWIVTDIFDARYASFVTDGSNVQKSQVNALLAQNLNMRRTCVNATNFSGRRHGPRGRRRSYDLDFQRKGSVALDSTQEYCSKWCAATHELPSTKREGLPLDAPDRLLNQSESDGGNHKREPFAPESWTLVKREGEQRWPSGFSLQTIRSSFDE